MSYLLDFAPYAASVAAGLIIGLKIIAPRTKSKLDDRVLDFLVAVVPHLPRTAPKPPASVRNRIIDHRAGRRGK